MTALRWVLAAWLAAFVCGVVGAWYVSGLAVPDRDDRARVPEKYAAEISTARASQAGDAIIDLPLTVDGSGPARLGVVALDERPYRIRVVYRGAGPFRVVARPTVGEGHLALVDRTGAWDGTAAFVPPIAGRYDLSVEAAGGWSLEITADPR